MKRSYLIWILAWWDLLGKKSPHPWHCTHMSPYRYTYLGKITLISIYFRLVTVDPNNNSDIQRFSHLDISIKYQYLTSIIILIPTSRCFDTIVDGGYQCHAIIDAIVSSTFIWVCHSTLDVPYYCQPQPSSPKFIISANKLRF